MTPHEAARRLEWTGGEYMLRWLAGMPDVSVTPFGEARAARTPDQPDVDFLNTVHRLLPGDAGQVPRIAAHYAEAGVVPWVELMPAPGFGDLARALREVDGRHVGYLNVFQRRLTGGALDLPEPPPDVTVEAIEGPGPAEDAFQRVLPAGHGVEDLAGAVLRTRAVAGIDGATRYLARVDGQPAAAGVLFRLGDLGYLASAATLEPFRRRGCQAALIRRRLADAAAAGCTTACTLTDWASQSHANMARAGFTTAYTKAVWTLGPASVPDPH
jgi:hypothetical protein